MLQIKFEHQSWSWSSKFPIDHIGNFVVVLRRSGGGVRAKYLMRVQVKKTVHDSLDIVFLPESRRYPPFRIQNYTNIPLKFCQSNLKHKIWDTVKPQHATAFAWDDLLSSNEGHLRIEFPRKNMRNTHHSSIRHSTATEEQQHNSSRPIVKDFSLVKIRTFKSLTVNGDSIVVSIVPDGLTKEIIVQHSEQRSKKFNKYTNALK